MFCLVSPAALFLKPFFPSYSPVWISFSFLLSAASLSFFLKASSWQWLSYLTSLSCVFWSVSMPVHTYPSFCLYLCHTVFLALHPWHHPLLWSLWLRLHNMHWRGGGGRDDGSKEVNEVEEGKKVACCSTEKPAFLICLSS